MKTISPQGLYLIYFGRITSGDNMRSPLRRMTVLILLIIAFLLSYSPVSHAQVGDISGIKVSLVFNNVPLRDALLGIAEQTGVSIIFSDDLVKDKTVGAEFREAGLEFVLRRLLRSNGLYFTVSTNSQVIIHQQPYPGLESTIITGRVVNRNTGEPLELVNVYIANTFLGAATDKDGLYSITNIPEGNHTLVVSMVGYETEEKKIRYTFPTYERIDFAVTEKVDVQDEVVVTATSPQNWKKYFADFERAFIGESRNAKKTEILNPEVLEFDYNEEYDILTAKANEALVIENESLGYRLYYTLKEFVMTDRYLAYKGYPKFMNLIPDNLTDAVEWRENRDKTYKGSMRHFLRILIHGDVNSTDFDVREVKIEKETDSLYTFRHRRYYNYIKSGGRIKIVREVRKWGRINISVIPGEIDSEWTLKFKNYLKVIYKYRTNSSVIGLWGDSALLHEKGYLYEPYDLLVTGKWAESRISDLLPFEYDPEKGR